MRKQFAISLTIAAGVLLTTAVVFIAVTWFGYGQSRKPELHPVSVTFTPPSPVEPVTSIVRVSSEIANTGGSAAGKFPVAFEFCRATRRAGITVCKDVFKRFAIDTVFSLDAGERKTASGLLDPNKVKQESGITLKGLLLVKVIVDPVADSKAPKGQIDELDENNNEIIASLTIGTTEEPGPSLTAQDFFRAGAPIRSSPVIGTVEVEANVKKQAIFFGADDGKLYAIELATGKPVFIFATGGPIRTTPVIDEIKKAIYFGSDDGNLYAVRLAKEGDNPPGSQKWRFPDPADPNKPTAAIGPVRSSPAIDVSKNRLYFGTDSGVLFAVDRDTGRQALIDTKALRFSTGGPIRTTPVIDIPTNAIYFGSDDGKLYARSRADLETQIFAAVSTGGPIRSSPVLDAIPVGAIDATIYFGSDDSKLYPIKRDGTGRIQTEAGTPGGISTGDAIRTTPAIDLNKNAVYFVSDSGKLHAIGRDLSAKFATPIVAAGVPTPADDEPRSSPRVDRGVGGGGTGLIFVGSLDGNLYVIGPDTGEIVKIVATNGPVRTTPVLEAVSGALRVFFGSDDGVLYMARLEF